MRWKWRTGRMDGQTATEFSVLLQLGIIPPSDFRDACGAGSVFLMVWSKIEELGLVAQDNAELVCASPIEATKAAG